MKQLHDLNQFYNKCSSCHVIVDDGSIIDEKYYCYECELKLRENRLHIDAHTKR